MSADSVDRALRALTDRALALLPDSLRSEALLLRSKSEAAGADRLTEAELARLHELNTAALDLLSPAQRAEWNRIVGAVMRQYSSQEFPAGK